MDDTPKWIPVLFGSVMLLMGALILGALFGIVPTDEDGAFLAPPMIIAALGLGFILGAFLLWIPDWTPPLLRTFLFLVTLALVAVVCNWTAFAPQVVYYSSTSIGPVQFSGESKIGGRIVFGIAALIVDSIFISTLIAWVRSIFRPMR
ncbi:MAG: hypothetical protein QY332_16680 [Anaerolineales bacterium]|nr:MAG: hypothetical protein QY332_16680 [Anaerolineales bacterium]